MLTFKHSLTWVYIIFPIQFLKHFFHIKDGSSQFFLPKLYNLCTLQACLIDIVLCCCFSDFNSLSSLDTAKNSQLAFDVARTELGISPVMSGQEMATCSAPDKLTMVSYLSQFYHKFHRERNPSGRATGRVTDKCGLLYHTSGIRLYYWIGPAVGLLVGTDVGTPFLLVSSSVTDILCFIFQWSPQFAERVISRRSTDLSYRKYATVPGSLDQKE